MEILSNKVVNARKEFIAKASLCEFNRIWFCTHSENKGNKCTSICKHYKNPEDETCN